MLRAKNWARWFYIIFGSVLRIIDLGAAIFVPSTLLPSAFGAALFILFAWILTQRAANYYFGNPEADAL
jgi:hypothetical protein